MQEQLEPDNLLLFLSLAGCFKYNMTETSAVGRFLLREAHLALLSS